MQNVTSIAILFKTTNTPRKQRQQFQPFEAMNKICEMDAPLISAQQQNTFTRWINQQLKVVNSSIIDLECDLCDGIQLIKLAQVLSGKKIPRYNKQPSMRTQKLDNVSLVLKFFQEQEGIKIVNIGKWKKIGWCASRNKQYAHSGPEPKVDSGSDLDPNPPLLHLQPTLTTTDQTSNSTTTHSKDNTTPRQRLMAWIKSKLPADAPVTNFTSDWNDGLALGGLVNACVPGSCADWREWRPDEALQNTLKAMQAAEDNLGVGRLITPEELINPLIDEKSIMTYLSQFPRAKPQPRGRISGIEESPLVGQTTHFFVDLENRNGNQQHLEPEVQVVDPQGNVLLPVSVDQNTAFPTRYDTSFVPKQPGKHKIIVTLTQKSDPTDTNQQPDLHLKLNELTVTAVPAPTLTGLSSPAQLGDQQKFRVTNVDEERQLDVLVVDPQGKEVVVDCQECVGSSRSFPLRVTAPVAVDAVVWGRGLCPQGTCAGDELPIHVENCSGPVEVTVTTKEGLLVPVTQLTSPPQTSRNIKRESIQDKSRAQEHVHNPSDRSWSGKRYSWPQGPFYVDTKGNTNLLEFSIEGPSKTDIHCVDNEDGTAVVEYTPSSSGKLPFIVMVEDEDDSNKEDAISTSNSNLQTPLQIRASGFEEWNKSSVGDPFKFSIGKSNNLEGKPLEVTVYDPELKKIDTLKTHSTSTSHNFSFLPEKPGKHVISVTTEDGVAVAGWPFPVVVRPALELSNLRVFDLELQTVGSIDVEALISDPEGLPTSVDLVGDNGGLFTATYTPTKTGEHKIKVLVEREPCFDIKIDVGAAVKTDEDNNGLNGRDGVHPHQTKA
uniref:Calponin-homology (CH) domain-containing protein n=1 Tax=Ditylenchus dipsaci TaxID=166011 RepID=A0A915EFX8_9BILA